jgi:hypothetical protein
MIHDKRLGCARLVVAYESWGEIPLPAGNTAMQRLVGKFVDYKFSARESR